MINPGSHNPMNPSPATVPYKPMSIYYGERMPEDKLEQFHEVVVTYGIKEHKIAIEETHKNHKMRVNEVLL